MVITCYCTMPLPYHASDRSRTGTWSSVFTAGLVEELAVYRLGHGLRRVCLDDDVVRRTLSGSVCEKTEGGHTAAGTRCRLELWFRSNKP